MIPNLKWTPDKIQHYSDLIRNVPTLKALILSP